MDGLIVIGSTHKVRNLKGVYKVIDSFQIFKKRRYVLKGISHTGTVHDTTEAYEEDLRPVPEPADPVVPGHQDVPDAMPDPLAFGSLARANAAQSHDAGTSADSAAYDAPRDPIVPDASASPSAPGRPRSDNSEITKNLEELQRTLDRLSANLLKLYDILNGGPKNG